ncbi:MAG: hypothetical protein EA384_09385 [Spirochaetaceae bacterium]|nr:MAG: hypothetical protein EA384_09385 [Spirochaetaceae bacterium]
MKVLVADAFADQAVDELRSLGLEVDYQPGLGAGDLPAALGTASVLIVRSTRVSAEAIDAASELSLIVRAGAGVNTIDIVAANRRGIFVANCPGRNSVAVAELTLGLMLALDRRIADNVLDFRSGAWNKARYSKAKGIAGLTFGIVGFGQIGKEVATRATAFDMRVLAWSRSLTLEVAEGYGVGYCSTIEELIGASDVVSLHAALTDETRGLISAERIALMKPGSVLLNTSRAELVDEQALVAALESGAIRAGLDVIQNEPEGKSGTVESALRSLSGVIVTHHIGASTDQAQNAVAEEAVRIVRNYSQTGHVPNWVNRSSDTAANWQLAVRHYDKPGVLANVLTELKRQNINAEELENVIFEGNQTACCTIKLDDRPSDATLARIRSRGEEVISVTLFSG